MRSRSKFPKDHTICCILLHQCYILVDTTSPPKQNLEISSSNSNATLAKSGDTINVTLTASEPIQSASSTIFARTANVAISGNTVEATASVISSDTGSVTFEMQVYDHAGNSLTLTQSDLTSSNVLIDNTSPTKQQLEISSSNSNATLAKSGDTITVTLTASEPIQSASSTIFARTANVVISGNTVKATASVISSDTGPATFEMQVYDHAGNSLTLTQSDLTSSNILVDNNAPSETNLEIYSDNTRDSLLANTGDMVTVILETNEILASASATILSRNADITISDNMVTATMLVLENDADGFIQFSISVVDHVGNMLTLVHTDIFPPAYVDNTPPTLSALSITSDNPVDPKSALLNDVITITANFDSAIYDVSATIFNRVATTSILA